MSSLYEIPDGCICFGDGLMGMEEEDGRTETK